MYTLKGTTYKTMAEYAAAAAKTEMSDADILAAIAAANPAAIAKVAAETDPKATRAAAAAAAAKKRRRQDAEKKKARDYGLAAAAIAISRIEGAAAIAKVAKTAQDAAEAKTGKPALPLEIQEFQTAAAAAYDSPQTLAAAILDIGDVIETHGKHLRKLAGRTNTGGGGRTADQEKRGTWPLRYIGYHKTHTLLVGYTQANNKKDHTPALKSKLPKALQKQAAAVIAAKEPIRRGGKQAAAIAKVAAGLYEYKVGKDGNAIVTKVEKSSS